MLWAYSVVKKGPAFGRVYIAYDASVVFQHPSCVWESKIHWGMWEIRLPGLRFLTRCTCVSLFVFGPASGIGWRGWLCSFVASVLVRTAYVAFDRLCGVPSIGCREFELCSAGCTRCRVPPRDVREVSDRGSGPAVPASRGDVGVAAGTLQWFIISQEFPHLLKHQFVGF